MEDTMRKEEFLRQLEQLLSGISEEERADAMAYYRSYFEDAGVENEASILEKLESPQKVAQSILKDLGIVAEIGGSQNKNSSQNGTGYGNGSSYGGSYGSGYGSSYGNGNGCGSSYQNGCGDAGGQNSYASYGNDAAQNRQKNRQIGMAAVIIAAVLLSPLWLSLLGIIFGAIVSVAATIFGIAVALIAIMGSLLFVGFLLIGIGFGAMFGGSIAAGLGIIGTGLLMLSLGILTVILVVWFAGAFCPWAYRGIRDCWQNFWNHRKEKKVL